MSQSFICPKCESYLNVGESIILSAETKTGSRGLIFFSPEIGNYTIKKNTNFEIKKGEKYDFFCPLCNKKLAADIHDDLAHIILIDTDNKKYQILFSKIAGEKSTYKIIGETYEIYGDQKSNYIDFISLSQNK